MRALAISQRGHGESDRPASGYAIEDLAADALSLLDAARIDEATIVGHSMGSLVAQELALSHPDRICGLVLVGAATTFDRPLAHELFEAVRGFGDAIPYELVRDFQASTVHRPVTEAFMRTVVSESMKVPARIWRDALVAQIGYRSGDRLAQLAAPTLIVWGDRDEITTRAEQDRLHRRIRGSTLLAYAQIGHAPHWEDPHRFVDDLLTFLSR